MSKPSPDWGVILFLGYMIAGLPIAWFHMRQQRMIESYNQIPIRQAQALILCTLAVMWPLLLLSDALNRHQLQAKRKRAMEKPGRTEAKPEQRSLPRPPSDSPANKVAFPPSDGVGR